MSRSEPSSAANRYLAIHARTGPDVEKPAPTKAAPVKSAVSKRIRVRVEPAKKRDLYRTRWQDLTPEEMASFRLYPKDGQR